MPAFRDENGEQWQVRVTPAALERCRDLAGVDLLDIIGGEEFAVFIGDPVRATKAIYAAVKPEADRKSVSESDFMERLFGDSLEQARQALMDAIVDFFPSPAERRARKALLAEIRRAIDEAYEEMEREATPDKLRELMKSAAASTSSPESPESVRET